MDDTYQAQTEYQTAQGYPVYKMRNGHGPQTTIAYCRTKTEARKLASELGKAAQTMRWQECVDAMAAERNQVAEVVA
jgi:hypothetical protein